MGVRHPELVLAAAILISLPVAFGVLSGEIDPMAALLRFLGALLLCWLGGSMLSAITGRYADIARRRELMATLEEARKKREEAMLAKATRKDGTAEPPPAGPPQAGAPPPTS